ncbi:MAG: hypothetical protein RIB85_29690 [Thalassobaculum sp.]
MISEGLKAVAKKLGTPVVALSQLSRASRAARTSVWCCRTCASRARSSRTPKW